MTVECNDAATTALTTWLGTISGMDNCDPSLVYSNIVFNTISGCGNTNTEIYKFTAEDNEGNVESCYAEFKIEDTVMPLVVDDVRYGTTVQCDSESNLPDFIGWLQTNAGLTTVTEVCGSYQWMNDYEANLDELPICNGLDRFYRIDVNFWVEDECGNASAPIEKRWRIEDATAPELSCPDNITLECSAAINASVITNWLGTVSAYDDCHGPVEVLDNYEEIFTSTCGLARVHTVTFTATDPCGNQTNCDRTITIVDSVSPEITINPIDLVLECAGSANEDDIQDWENNFGGAVAFDSCSDTDLTWSIISQVTVTTCGNAQTTLYTFQVTDNCTNTATTQARIVIEDNTSPVLTVPVNELQECNNITVALSDWLEEVEATDTCGSVTTESILWNTTSSCGGATVETYRFTATDACGNTSIGYANYQIQDTSNPMIECPSNLVLVCGNENNDLLVLNWLNSATVADTFGCSQVELVSDYPTELPSLTCNNGLGNAITFTAIDECGNIATCVSTITMQDTENPYFSNCPIDMTVNVDVDRCSNNIIYSQPVALDDCDEEVAVALIDGVPAGNPFPLGVTTVTFEAVDQCNNTSTCSFEITVVDSDDPSISCPSNDVVVCTDTNTCTWEATDQTDPIYNDNCPGQVLTFVTTGALAQSSTATGINLVEEEGLVFGLGESRVMYTISDPAGNSASWWF